MKKIRFSEDVFPHIIALIVFLLVTLFFFSPVFFENKTLSQHDIQMFQGSAKSIADYRDKTGEEALWADAMFSGMPAYLISVEWSNGPVTFMKQILGLFLVHPVANIFTAFVCFYILLLAFRVRPYLAIGGAIAFGLSSYIIIGLGAGHNGRIGAIAFLPLVVAGIHLAFSKNKLLGASLTAAGMALHLRENHLQMTYYLMLIILIYGFVQLIYAIKDKTIPDLAKTVGILVLAVAVGAGTFFGQFWAITEYSAYSTRAKSELTDASAGDAKSGALGMTKEYAFEFSNGILEPLTLLVPNIYGGSSSDFFVKDQKSESYKALVSSGNQQNANQLAQYTSAYWGEQRMSAPYYAGAIIVFLFAVGIAFAGSKHRWWLVPVVILGIVFSWGSNFSSFNYFMFDYFPGYDKFRSVTFAIVMPLFAMTLLGFIGLEKLWSTTLDKAAKRNLLIAFLSTGGLCLLLWAFAGMFNFLREGEQELPDWFTTALASDRESLLRSDAFRSFAFILSIFLVLYFQLQKKISPVAVYVFLAFMITIDLFVVDKRFITKDSYRRDRDSGFVLQASDQVILNDKSYYRVYNLGDNPFAEARTSYFHKSVGGYHGAKMRRYSDFYDSCMIPQTQQFIKQANSGNLDFANLPAFNMLNIKYIQFGPAKANVIPNKTANGPAWFVQKIEKVNSPTEELAKTCAIDSKSIAIVDASKFTIAEINGDSTATISLKDQTPKYLKYESNSSVNGLVVFSEIYYPHGWVAKIDNQESKLIRADYILRAMEIPAGKHTIELTFEPEAYVIGNKVTMASSWLVLLFLIGGIAMSLKEEKHKEVV
jgi:hypothetical protein